MPSNIDLIKKVNKCRLILSELLYNDFAKEANMTDTQHVL